MEREPAQEVVVKWMFLSGLVLALAACSGSSVDDSPTPLTTPTSTTVPLTTTVPETTTTTLSPARWRSDVFVPVVDEYNEQFGTPYEDHRNDLEFSEAQLDCVEVLPMIDSWQEQLKPAPDPSVDALIDTAFERFAEGLDRCIAAETLGDWREVGYSFEAFVDALTRISDKTAP